MKHFNKNNNNLIYNLPLPTENIKKINSNNVHDDKIYHRALNTLIPVLTFATLEGDINKRTMYVTLDEEIHQLEYHNEDNYHSLIRNEDNHYLVTSRLKNLMVKLNYDAIQYYDDHELLTGIRHINFRHSEAGFEIV